MMSKDDNSPQRFSLIAALRHMGSFVCFVYVCISSLDGISTSFAHHILFPARVRNFALCPPLRRRIDRDYFLYRLGRRFALQSLRRSVFELFFCFSFQRLVLTTRPPRRLDFLSLLSFCSTTFICSLLTCSIRGSDPSKYRRFSFCFFYPSDRSSSRSVRRLTFSDRLSLRSLQPLHVPHRVLHHSLSLPPPLLPSPRSLLPPASPPRKARPASSHFFVSLLLALNAQLAISAALRAPQHHRRGGLRHHLRASPRLHRSAARTQRVPRVLRRRRIALQTRGTRSARPTRRAAGLDGLRLAAGRLLGGRERKE